VGRLQEVPDAAGEVALEAADGFAGGLAFGAFAVEVGPGVGGSADKPIKLLGLDRVLPFAAPGDALDCQPGESVRGPAPRGKGPT
jgi:hypothetical protein